MKCNVGCMKNGLFTRITKTTCFLSFLSFFLFTQMSFAENEKFLSSSFPLDSSKNTVTPTFKFSRIAVSNAKSSDVSFSYSETSSNCHLSKNSGTENVLFSPNHSGNNIWTVSSGKTLSLTPTNYSSKTVTCKLKITATILSPSPMKIYSLESEVTLKGPVLTISGGSSSLPFGLKARFSSSISNSGGITFSDYKITNKTTDSCDLYVDDVACSSPCNVTKSDSFYLKFLLKTDKKTSCKFQLSAKRSSDGGETTSESSVSVSAVTINVANPNPKISANSSSNFKVTFSGIASTVNDIKYKYSIKNCTFKGMSETTGTITSISGGLTLSGSYDGNGKTECHETFVLTRNDITIAEAKNTVTLTSTKVESSLDSIRFSNLSNSVTSGTAMDEGKVQLLSGPSSPTVLDKLNEEAKVTLSLSGSNCEVKKGQMTGTISKGSSGTYKIGTLILGLGSSATASTICSLNAMVEVGSKKVPTTHFITVIPIATVCTKSETKTEEAKDTKGNVIATRTSTCSSDGTKVATYGKWKLKSGLSSLESVNPWKP